MARSSRIGTQVRVFAVSGLERSHSKPFVRLVYTETADSDGSRGNSDTGGVARALESASEPVEYLPERRGGHYYTALWPHDRSSGISSPSKSDECSFELPARVDLVELQVWNRFASGFDVLLAKTALSVEQLRAQLTDEDGHTGGSQSTDCMWVPFQMPTRYAAPDLRGLKLSAQLAVDFLYDDRVAHIRQQICDRNASKTGKSVDPGEEERIDQPRDEVADPTFAFTTPFLPVDWSVVATASVCQLFFYNDVARVAKFRELVLYGDIARELVDEGDGEDDDFAFHVDPGHSAAFQLAQFAAQYLSHCVDSLDTRVDEYSDQLCSLTDAAQRLRHRNRVLRHQRKRLEQERDQLALMIKAYERVGQGGGGDTTVDAPSSNYNRQEEAREVEVPRASLALVIDNNPSPVKPLNTINASAFDNPASPTVSSPLSAKKPTFIMTWEERERERQREKEVTKAQRVQEEQRRLQQRLEERAEHDLRVAEATRRRDQSARVLQRSLRRRVWIQRSRRHRQMRAISTCAAVVIQARFRQWRLTRTFPFVHEMLKQEREQRWMGVEDELSRHCVQPVEATTNTVIESENLLLQEGKCFSEDPSPLEPLRTPSKEDVEALVSTWREIRRVVRRDARARGHNGDSDFRAVFRALDTRRDGVIDRAELRRGIRERFGLQLDRKLTRGILALIRGKADEPPRPLLLTLDQFIRGLDLARIDSARTSGTNSTCDSHPKRDGGVLDNETANVSHDLSTYEDRQPETGPSRLEDALAHPSSIALEAVEEDSSIDRRLEAVAAAVQALRNAVNTAAREHLAVTGTLGKAPSYREFRAALSHVFTSFDSDGNGQLDMRELGECLKLIGVRVTEKNLLLVRECFCSSASDPGGNSGDENTVTIVEFISFVLSDAGKANPTDELGLLGFRVRSAVLGRLERARAHLDSKGEPANTEDALRWVFRSAYPGKQCECPLREFARVLRTIKGLESLSPAKVARVAARLDRNGDQTISFDELLAWLRLLPATLASTETSAAAEVASLQLAEPGDRRSGFRAVLRDATRKVQRLREWLSQVASALKDDSGAKTYTKTAQASALFDRVDTNGSGKIARDELEIFFASLPPELAQLTHANTAANVSDIADQLVDVMDCSGNGVVTRDEWLRFALDLHAPIAEEFAVRVALRSEVEPLSTSIGHDVMASQWLERLPGAIPMTAPVSREGVAPSIHGVRHSKIRVGEFKNAMRKAIEASGGGGNITSPPSVVPLVASAVDAAVKQLDSDGSGWITTAKLLRWLFPMRDLEELLRLLRLRWRHQWLSNQASPRLMPVQSAEKLYSLFDADGNGWLARKELKAGFRSILGLEFAECEVETLVAAFDADGDGLWSRQEFLAFAQEVVQGSAAGTNETTSDVGQIKQAAAAIESNETAGSNSDSHDDDDDPLLLSSSSSSSETPTPAASPSIAASASAVYSGASFQDLSGLTMSAIRSHEASPLRPTMYEDDFDE